jgi:peptide-methionine (R)-S-oxide reductase
MVEIKKTDAEWQAKLTPEQYQVARQCGTEPPFSGALLNVKEAGTFKCVCCGAELFKSDAKYDSGSGWPSFWQAINPDAVATKADTSHGMVRTEITCAQCDAHLGHVFTDGPQPTGQRYCVNSLSLTFEKSN